MHTFIYFVILTYLALISSILVSIWNLTLFRHTRFLLFSCKNYFGCHTKEICLDERWKSNGILTKWIPLTYYRIFLLLLLLLSRLGSLFIFQRNIRPSFNFVTIFFFYLPLLPQPSGRFLVTIFGSHPRKNKKAAHRTNSNLN